MIFRISFPPVDNHNAPFYLAVRVARYEQVQHARKYFKSHAWYGDYIINAYSFLSILFYVELFTLNLELKSNVRALI